MFDLFASPVHQRFEIIVIAVYGEIHIALCFPCRIGGPGRANRILDSGFVPVRIRVIGDQCIGGTDLLAQNIDLSLQWIDVTVS